MSEPGLLLTGGQILDLLRELADRLPASRPRPVLILVGGALLATAGLRDTTQDADSCCGAPAGRWPARFSSCSSPAARAPW